MGIQSEWIFAMVHLPQEDNFLSPPSLITVISKRNFPIYRLHELMWCEMFLCMRLGSYMLHFMKCCVSCLLEESRRLKSLNIWGKEGQHIATKEYPCISIRSSIRVRLRSVEIIEPAMSPYFWPWGWNLAINNWGKEGQHIATKEYPCIGCAMVLWSNDVQVYT